MSRDAPLLCLYTDSLEPSGVGRHMLMLADKLRDRYRVSFVCPPTTGGMPLLKEAGALGLRTLALEADDPRGALRDWLRATGVEVFHAHAGIGWEGHPGIHAARAAGVPTVVRTEHLPDLITDPVQRRDYDRMHRRVDRIVCVSETARDSFVRAGVPAHKLLVIRNGIAFRSAAPDPAEVRARLGLPFDATLVLTVARLTEQKGHRHLLEAAPAVRERVPGAHFVWVGEGPLGDELRKRTRELGIEGNVHLTGRRTDVPDLLAAAELFVLPSLFEGLPLVVLEAMAAGVPVVGTRVCGTREAVEDGVCGRLVPARDPAALAAAILEVLERPDLGARWGAAGRRRARREFSAARMARETAALYQETRHGERHPSNHHPHETRMTR